MQDKVGNKNIIWLLRQLMYLGCKKHRLRKAGKKTIIDRQNGE